ncbi:MAG TPA: fibronectin type III domain-containing protein, partial [Caldithrix sp.]|nr:fibronectin type III domain-containing protein [Caldithrix sp.]
MLNSKLYISILLLIVSIGYSQTTQWRLLWDPNTESDMHYYKIFRDTHTLPTTQIDTTIHPHTEYIDTDIVPGTRYYYRLKAVDSSGLESDYSAEVSAAIPNVTNIPNQTVNQGQNFVINLNNYVTDPDHADSEIEWTYSNNSELTISINASKIATITPSSGSWYGLETVTFTATDPDEFFDIDAATLSVNALPVVGTISNQTINQGGTFTTISLDNFVADPDDADAEISWSASGNSNLNVNISSNRIATISTPSPNWYGQETITFTAADPNGATDNVAVVFTVNGQPQITRTSPMDQKIGQGQSFTTFDLDAYVSDPDNSDNELNWTYSDNSIVQVSINASHVVTITPQSSEMLGADTVLFRVQDPGGLSDQIEVVFAIIAMGTPLVSEIPNQYINRGSSFSQITLDNFVDDPESPDTEISWAYNNASNVTISINANRIVTITASNAQWVGNDTISFIATDPQGNSDSTLVIFTVNGAPVLTAIPNQEIEDGQSFSNISLDNYVTDPNDNKSVLSWSYRGNNQLTINVNEFHIATIASPSPDWTGTEQITFRVTDPGSLMDSVNVSFTVNGLASPNVPLIQAIVDQVIDRYTAFTDINLNELIIDSDTAPEDIAWSYSGNSELIVEITSEHIARIARSNINWMGSETITFTATDPEGNSDKETATFTVNARPEIINIYSQIIEAGHDFLPIALDDFVNDLNNTFSELNWGVSGNSELSISISNDRIVTIQAPTADWVGSESIIFTVTDPYNFSSNDTATFTVVPAGTDVGIEVLTISGQSITQGQVFETINLDEYVDCNDALKSELTWTCSGNTNLQVEISSDRIASVSSDNAGWFGQETITFRAATPNGIFDETSAVFTIKQNIFSSLNFHLMGSGTI